MRNLDAQGQDRVIPVNATRLRAESELFLLLSRAFLPPLADDFRAAMVAFLADDLAVSAAAMRLDIEADVLRLRAALAGLDDGHALVGLYSRIHLAPPVLAPLNAGLYLDGALQGASVLAMEAWYRRHGVQRAARFKDLADHISVQLEFVAHLLADAAAADSATANRLRGEAEAFVEAFLMPWIPQLRNRMDDAAAAGAPATPYRPLLTILMAALDAMPHGPPAPAHAPTVRRHAG